MGVQTIYTVDLIANGTLANTEADAYVNPGASEYDGAFFNDVATVYDPWREESDGLQNEVPSSRYYNIARISWDTFSEIPADADVVRVRLDWEADALDHDGTATDAVFPSLIFYDDSQPWSGPFVLDSAYEPQLIEGISSTVTVVPIGQTFHRFYTGYTEFTLNSGINWDVATPNGTDPTACRFNPTIDPDFFRYDSSKAVYVVFGNGRLTPLVSSTEWTITSLNLTVQVSGPTGGGGGTSQVIPF